MRCAKLGSVASILMTGKVRFRQASRGLLERLGLRKPWPLAEMLERMTDAEREAYFRSIGFWDSIDGALAEYEAEKSKSIEARRTND